MLDFTGATVGYLKVLGRIGGSLKWEAMCTACGQRTTRTSRYLQCKPEASCADCAERRKALRRSMSADELEHIRIPELTDEEVVALCGEDEEF